MSEHVRTRDRAATGWAERNSLLVLRVGLGIVFLWFGALKLFSGLSPAEGLIASTVSWAVDPEWFIPLLGIWECAIGIGLLFKALLRVALLLLFVHMAGTFMPLVVCPELVWTDFPFRWTLEGQYILKNLVLIGGALTLAGQARRPAASGTPRRSSVQRSGEVPAAGASPLRTRRRRGVGERVPSG